MEKILLLICVTAAVVTDYKTYKIPNRLTGTFLCLGIVYHMVVGERIASLLGMVFPLVLLVLFAVRMIGAGDIKLFCAIGAIVAYPAIVEIMLFSILCNGVIALILLCYRKNGLQRMKKLFLWLKTCYYTRSFMEYTSFTEKDDGIFRYTYGIFFGCWIQMFLEWW